MGKPVIKDIGLMVQAGIDPKTKLPIRAISGCPTHLKEDIKKQLRIIDEQDAVNRYVWYNLPCNITSQDLERLLYYKGQLCFFYNTDDQQFYFMPYVLDGTIDFYGRYNRVHPVPMTAGEDDTKTARYKAQATLLAEKKLNCVYGIKLPEELEMKDLTESCVLLHDYTKQLAQTIIPRQLVNDPLLDVMAECIPWARTSRLLSTGITGVRVNNEDEAGNVDDANRQLEEAATKGTGFIPVVGKVDFQMMNGQSPAKGEEYMLAMQSLDNFRLSTYGIDNGGLFEKKAHELQSEADINGGPVGLVMQDGLSIRQNFCNIVNSLWNIGIWCEPAENIIGADMDGDGLAYDRNDDSSNSGVVNEGGNDDGE